MQGVQQPGVCSVNCSGGGSMPLVTAVHQQLPPHSGALPVTGYAALLHWQVACPWRRQLLQGREVCFVSCFGCGCCLQ